ncbi:MAG: hypothetical protein ABL956_14755 [Hyphomonadaceae bacterium]
MAKFAVKTRDRVRNPYRFACLIPDARLDFAYLAAAARSANGKVGLRSTNSALLASMAGPLGLLPFAPTGGEPDAPCATRGKTLSRKNGLI